MLPFNLTAQYFSTVQQVSVQHSKNTKKESALLHALLRQFRHFSLVSICSSLSSLFPLSSLSLFSLSLIADDSLFILFSLQYGTVTSPSSFSSTIIVVVSHPLPSFEWCVVELRIQFFVFVSRNKQRVL